MADVASLLPRGIYRIAAVELGRTGPNVLARQEGDRVTVLDRSVAPEPEQEWQVVPLPNGKFSVTRPSPIIPAFGLTYEGAPNPNEGAHVVQRVQEFPTEWQVDIAPGFRHTLRVPNTDFGIAISPLEIHPPILELNRDAGSRQLYWVFERLRED